MSAYIRLSNQTGKAAERGPAARGRPYVTLRRRVQAPCPLTRAAQAAMACARAAMAELVDAVGLGPTGQPWGFESL